MQTQRQPTTPEHPAGSSPPSQALWETALAWVAANRTLVRQIAAPYRRHMAADTTDLEQEAVVAAFQALQEIARKEEAGPIGPFFRVIFRTNCIRLASGIRTMDCAEIDNIPAPLQEQEQQREAEQEVIQKALQGMTKRQRQFCTWLLRQPEPVNMGEVARAFKISRRHAFRLLSGSIDRLGGEGAP